MKKCLNEDDLIETNSPMNAVAADDARAYLGLHMKKHLTPVEIKLLRAKKKKIVTSSKKMDRKISRLLTTYANCIGDLE